jgi:hypothetical protein
MSFWRSKPIRPIRTWQPTAFVMRPDTDLFLPIRWVRMVSPSSRGDHNSHSCMHETVLVLSPGLEASSALRSRKFSAKPEYEIYKT